jgi:Ser/Thr protein kinase RdoA (MazF antagonist)/cytidylate kinase
VIRQSVTLDEVARQAASVVGGPREAFVGKVVELYPHGTVRSFRAGDVVVRVDEDPDGISLELEALVLDALRTAAAPALAPEVLARGRLEVEDGAAGGARPFLAYPWVAGRTLDKASASARARDVGAAFARLHAARVMDLFGRLPRERPLTLLESFRRSVEELRGWMAARELDGLGQDLLTLALSDLQRALRPYCIAQDHLFLTSRRRVLCHGRPSPAFVVVRTDAPPVPPPLCFVGLDGACLGDAADDLSAFALAAGLDEASEDAMLRAYLESLDREGRLDRRFIPRYFARRTLGLFAQPVARLDLLVRMKRGDVPVLGDPVVAIEENAQLAYEELARAMNALRDLGGRARPVGVAEVMAMGRVLAVEEMILAGRAFRIGVIGQPYVGKTEVAARLAMRLRHRFFGTAALSRALALVEREAAAEGGDEGGAGRQGAAALSPRALVERLFERGFILEPRLEPPFYLARLDGRDVTEELREGGPLQVRGAQLLDDDSVRGALRDELLRRSATEGLVVEGAYAPSLLAGRTSLFHLSADIGVRRARLVSHRPDVGTEEEAAALLARLDEAAPPPPPEVARVDVGSRTAAAATLEILWHLLPPGRRPHEDLTGRAPL